MPLKRGYTLLEIAIGLAILGIAGSMVYPSFARQLRRYEQSRCLAQFDSLVTQAALQSIQSGKVYRVKMNIAAGTEVVEKQMENENGEIVYEKVPLYFTDQDFVLPASYKVINFYIDGMDECAQHGAGRTMQDVWFFLYPRGYTQAVVINIVNEDDRSQSAHGSEIGLVLNPFRLQFEVHDAFQKP